jgi:hypothetical protein
LIQRLLPVGLQCCHTAAALLLLLQLEHGAEDVAERVIQAAGTAATTRCRGDTGMGVSYRSCMVMQWQYAHL